MVVKMEVDTPSYRQPQLINAETAGGADSTGKKDSLSPCPSLSLSISSFPLFLFFHIVWYVLSLLPPSLNSSLSLWDSFPLPLYLSLPPSLTHTLAHSLPSSLPLSRPSSSRFVLCILAFSVTCITMSTSQMMMKFRYKFNNYCMHTWYICAVINAHVWGIECIPYSISCLANTIILLYCLHAIHRWLSLPWQWSSTPWTSIKKDINRVFQVNAMILHA